jgi:hypothetical protein
MSVHTPSRRRAALRFVLAGLLAGLMLAVPSTASALVVGIADQKPEVFYDERFRDLGLTDSHLVVPWDSMKRRWQIREIDSWLDAAASAGIHQPLIAFDRSRVRRNQKPTKRQYMRQFRKFRARWPHLRTFTVWNEPNLWHQPVAGLKNVKFIVKLYKAVKRECRGCTVLPAELIDTPSMGTWVDRFEELLGRSPEAYGLHNYRDVNRRETKTTRRLLRATKADVWITETGGIVGREEGARAGQFPQTPGNAKKATRFLMRKMPKLSPRIKRIYIYHWSADKRGKEWDSAFIAPNGEARPALKVFERELKRLGLGKFRSDSA